LSNFQWVPGSGPTYHLDPTNVGGSQVGTTLSASYGFAFFCVLWELLEEEDFVPFAELNGVKLVDIGPVEAFPLDKI
jgi:hypothetical protein